MTKTISIDFDNTIHAYDGWDGGVPSGAPLPGAFEAIVKLRMRGYDVIVFTARPAQQAREWFHQHWPKRPPYAEPPMVTNQKVPSVVYIDDRALKFHNWEQTWKDLQAIL